MSSPWKPPRVRTSTVAVLHQHKPLFPLTLPSRIRRDEVILASARKFYSSQICTSSNKTEPHHLVVVRNIGSAFTVIANCLRQSDQSFSQRASTMEETHMENPNFGRETNLGETALTRGNLSLNNQRVNTGPTGYFTLYLAGGSSIGTLNCLKEERIVWRQFIANQTIFGNSQ